MDTRRETVSKDINERVKKYAMRLKPLKDAADAVEDPVERRETQILIKRLAALGYIEEAFGPAVLEYIDELQMVGEKDVEITEGEGEED